MQRAVNTTIEEEIFSMCFAYIHCWARDVFCRSASRQCKWYRTESNQKKREREREGEWGESSAVKEEGFG
jgi:hypothetical protein